MTNLLLIIIAVLLLARIVLQVMQGKRALDKGYCAPSEVENISVFYGTWEIDDALRRYGNQGYELVHAIRLNDGGSYQLFFTRKKIKNYYEE